MVPPIARSRQPRSPGGHRRKYAVSAMDERVLLVEDDPSIREVTTFGLKQAGFRVSAASDGREGLLRTRQEPFDLVVLDVMLPSLDGFEVCREIRKDSRVPIVMLTARG